MSINKGNVQITSQKVGDIVIFNAKLVINNENSIPLRTMNSVPKAQREEFVYGIEHILAMSIIAHIYGDLIDPINELANLAGHHVTGDDVEELTELRKQIGSILIGDIPQVKDDDVIITGN